jgi:hypothetical protein
MCEGWPLERVVVGRGSLGLGVLWGICTRWRIFRRAVRACGK